MTTIETGEDVTEADGAPPRRRPGLGQRLAPLLLVPLAVVAFVVAVVLGGTDPGQRTPSAPSDTAGAVAAGVSADGPTGSADEPHLDAEPTTDLIDGQEVFLVGTGFPGDTEVGALMCSAHLEPATGIDRCMTATFNVGRTDPFGRARITYRVSRVLTIGEREIDCAGPPPAGHPTSCRVVIGVIGDFEVYAAAELAFDPDGPLEVASGLSVEPSDDLLDQVEARLVITNPGVAVQWALTQCVSATSPPTCVPLEIVQPDDPSGRGVLMSTDGSQLEAIVRLTRYVDGTDCAAEPGACGVVARNLEDGRSHTQRLTFAP